MTTISTPGPLDQPDWYSPVPYAGRPLVNGAFFAGFGSPAHTTPVYVGTQTAVNFKCVVHGSPWILQVLWSTSQTYNADIVFIEEYSGVDVCTVLDNLPVLTPFVSFRFQCPHNVPNIEFELFAFTSIASKRQPIHHIDGGKVLQVEAGTALAGKETTVPGVFLAPGLYQWSYYTADPLTGQLQFVGIDYNSVKYPLTRLTDPPAFTQDFGQLIVSNLQVFFQVENTGLTDITFNCALVGPL